MHSVCLSSVLKKTAGALGALGVSLTLTSSAFAQTSATASSSLTKGGLGGSSSSLPSAGNTDVTYLIFGFGILFFVVGMMKLVASFRNSA
jgi:hypothetical protein